MGVGFQFFQSILFSLILLLCLSACLYLQTHTRVHARPLMPACTHAGGQQPRAFWLFFCLREAFLFFFRIYVDYSWIASLGAAAIATILWSFQELHKVLFFEIELDRQQVSSLQGGERGRDRESEKKSGKGEIWYYYYYFFRICHHCRGLCFLAGLMHAPA